MSNYKLLIVDDNEMFSRQLVQRFSQFDLYEVMEPVYDAVSALRQFKIITPDIVLVDMLMPVMDGAEFVATLREEGLGSKTKIIMMSSLVTDDMMMILQKLGVSYFIALPTDPATICKRVTALVQGKMKMKEVNDQQEKSVSTVRRDFTREELIVNYLRMLGVSPHLEGYAYLKTAINYYVENFASHPGVTTHVYPAVAKIHNKKEQCIERSIRNAIDTTWYKGNIEMQHKIFGYTVSDNKGRPTNKEFIALIADRAVARLKYRTKNDIT